VTSQTETLLCEVHGMLKDIHQVIRDMFDGNHLKDVM